MDELINEVKEVGVNGVNEVKPKKRGVHGRHEEVQIKIKQYVETEENFPVGSKTIRKISLELGIPYQTVMSNLTKMYWKGKLDPRVYLNDEGNRFEVFFPHKLKIKKELI